MSKIRVYVTPAAMPFNTRERIDAVVGRLVAGMMEDVHRGQGFVMAAAPMLDPIEATIIMVVYNGGQWDAACFTPEEEKTYLTPEGRVALRKLRAQPTWLDRPSA
jgi:hypothetical protein